MNIKWKGDNDRPRHGWLAFDADSDGGYILHIGARSADDIRDLRKPTRYCVFGRSSYERYCGDLPLDMPVDELKKVALVMWRLHPKYHESY